MTFDVVYRTLQYLGYKVRYVRNITDVGHLVDDADEGEDKIAKKARLENLEPMEIVQKYTNGFHDVMKMFNNLPPSIEPTATGHIVEQIEMIKSIMDNGWAYEVNHSVYFDVEKYNQSHRYGVLSGRVLEDLLETTRELEGQDEKKSKADFALWKKADKGHIMYWPSPWGKGFPGWHLECSAMSTKYLGATFDIHGGGMDLKFPHHECEIAQNVGSCGHAPVNYWMHSNMLNFNGQKMSKSLGNSILPTELVSGQHPLLDKGYSPMTVRFLFLQSHYSSELDISIKALQDAEKGYRKIVGGLADLNALQFENAAIDTALDEEINALINGLSEGILDDFNTAKTIAKLYALVTHINIFYNNGKVAKGISSQTLERLKKEFTAIVLDVLGLQEETASQQNDALAGAMGLIIKIRNQARTDKNWGLSDQIRDELKAAGIILKDSKEGTSYEVEA
jgi:cysteinyl-tRNA synthetase